VLPDAAKKAKFRTKLVSLVACKWTALRRNRYQ
jgi:hypothetical protein